MMKLISGQSLNFYIKQDNKDKGNEIHDTYVRRSHEFLRDIYEKYNREES
jgi:hypothetical protein